MKFKIKTSGGTDYRYYEWTGMAEHRHDYVQISASKDGVILRGQGAMLTLHEVEAVADVLTHAREVASSPAMFDANIAQFQVDSEAEYPRS